MDLMCWSIERLVSKLFFFMIIFFKEGNKSLRIFWIHRESVLNHTRNWISVMAIFSGTIFWSLHNSFLRFIFYKQQLHKNTRLNRKTLFSRLWFSKIAWIFPCVCYFRSKIVLDTFCENFNKISLLVIWCSICEHWAWTFVAFLG